MDRIRNVNIREAVGIEPLLLQVERSQLRWFGHVLRMGPDRLAKRVFQASFPPEMRRRVGRPRTTWEDQIYALLERAGLDLDTAELLALDRGTWSRLVSLLPPRP